MTVLAPAPRALPLLPRRAAVFTRLALLSTQTVFSFRFNIVFELVSVFLQILLLKIVWTAVYSDRGTIEGIDLATVLTYLTIANLQLWVIFPETGWWLQRKIKEGKIAQDLARPVSLITQLLAHQFGSTLFFVPAALAAMPVAFFVGVLRPPASLEAGILYVVSLALALGVVTSMGLLMGLVAFWTFETTGILAMYRFFNLFFAGALVPLWLFPGPLRVLAELLPFQTQANIPVSIYIGRLQGPDAIRGLIVQAVWVVLLALFVRFVYSRALRKVVVQGG